MKTKTYCLLTAALLGAVALAHAARAALHVPVQIGTWNVPVGTSVIALVVCGTLSFVGFLLARNEGKTPAN